MILTEERRLKILSYIVHAGEILQKEKHIPKKLYKYAYLPAGSELYTGAIKAAGYLFIDKNINNIIFIIEQNELPNEIVGYGESEFLIWGRNIKNQSKEITNKQLPINKELLDQLLYARLITQIDFVTILGIGTDVSSKEAKTVIKRSESLNQGIMIIGEGSKLNNSKSKKEDADMIEHVFQKKIYKKDSKRLGNLYIDIIKKKKSKPELVVYIHSSDLGTKTSKQIGYICMVG